MRGFRDRNEGMKLPRSLVQRVTAGFRRTKLGDPRRTARLVRVVGRIARQPSAPLPLALGAESEVEGAYRFMNNRRVDFDALIAVQGEIARQRAAEEQAVLVLHDTTDCSFAHLSAQEIGYLQTGKAGFRLHLSLVVAEAERRPLAVAHAQTIHRASRSKRGRTAPGTETAKWVDRESERWWRGMAASAELLRECPSVIHVADRESDSYELMAKLQQVGGRFIFRVRVPDRRARTVDSDGEDWSTVSEVAAQCEGTLEREVPLSRRTKKSAPGMNAAHPPRNARMANLRFAATRVRLPRPAYLRHPIPETIDVNLVRVWEIDSPDGEAPVEWLLFTSEPVATGRQIERVVDNYRARWLIEEFNSAIKTGCAFESRQFESQHALLVMLALSLPVAVEVLWLRARSRSSPDSRATEVVTPLQLRILRKLGSYKLGPKPTAADALMAVAKLGGHLSSNGPPGWKIMQRGMSQLMHYEAGWNARDL
jgi:Transposase DNA-binding/Transposase DDE domain